MNVPDGAHQRVDEELVLFRRSLFPGVPYLTVAALHEPAFEVNGMADVWVRHEGVGGQGQGLERGVEVGDAVLREQADEVQTADGELARGGRQDGAMRRAGGEARRAGQACGRRTCSRCSTSAVVRSSGRRTGCLVSVYSRTRRFPALRLHILWVRSPPARHRLDIRAVARSCGFTSPCGTRRPAVLSPIYAILA